MDLSRKILMKALNSFLFKDSRLAMNALDGISCGKIRIMEL